MNYSPRAQLLIEQLNKRILVLDGATGTLLQQKNLTANDFGGEQYEGCNEILVLTKPEAVLDVHKQYLDAGADIIETNSFGSTPIVLAEYEIQDKCYELNRKAAEIARSIADRYTSENPNKPRFVAGSMGPTTKALSITGDITFNELKENFLAQARGLFDGGADYFLLETCNDTRNIKAGIIAIHQLMREKNMLLPIAVSGTIEASGTMLAGQNAESLIASLDHLNLLYIGINCATGPDMMTDHIRSMSALSKNRISCVPNAGLPDENGKYLETPQMLCKVLERFIEQGWINVIGGCCGTNPSHIKAMSEMAQNKKPRVPNKTETSYLSGIDFLEITNEKRPVLVGERTNIIGSKKFKDMICEGKFDEAAEIAKTQVKTGADIIDICLANPDRNEFEDMEKFLGFVTKKIRVPLMIDTTDDKVIQMGLTYSQGKAIINSINLEDGEKRFKKVVPLAKEFGAALVIGTIDNHPEDGMARSRERKLEVAQKSYDLLRNKYDFPEADMYFDPLVFPCASGDEKYRGSAVETIEGIRLIKKQFPLAKTVVGLSNVSFGLPMNGREVLNSVFLYHCVEAGLDLAIVNSEKIKRYSSISPEEITLAENLLFNRSADPISEFANHFRNQKPTNKNENLHSNLPAPERLIHAVIDGMKNTLINDLNECLVSTPPMEIINGPLMQGMSEVGKLFNQNKLIVAEVLQSAEVMKTAVDHLKQFMKKGENVSKGKFLLATVKGDVHDIGKNLVDIVLSNNGFEVINLGIKISSDQLIQAAKEHRPDLIGLSGLLVKSALQMETSAQDLQQAGITAPLLVGGAALSRNFTDKKIAPAYGDGAVFYAKDAMDGLRIANTLQSTERQKFIEENAKQQKQERNFPTNSFKTNSNTPTKPSAVQAPVAPDWDIHILKNSSIEMIWRFINPKMLYGKHLGIKGNVIDQIILELETTKLEKIIPNAENQKALEIFSEVEKIKKQYRDTLVPSAVYKFFAAHANKDTIYLFNDGGSKPSAEIVLPRQESDDKLCLADYLCSDHASDNIAIFVVSVGKNLRHEVEKLKNDGKFLHSHILAALALESAEAYAEMLHGKIRALWGFPDDVEMTMKDRFKTKYRGKRYSFGYPACPELASQEVIFKLLEVEKNIDVKLTEGFMMDPEASVSAIVFHHPEAKYFSV